VEALVQAALTSSTAGKMQRLSYRALFQQHFSIDPHTTPLADLQRLTVAKLTIDPALLHSRSICLDLLYGHVIEPTLIEPVFIYHYPAEQAALSRVVNDEQGEKVALRFELVMRGMEIANGYDELSDAAEQRRRFAADRQQRQKQGLPDIASDERLLAALQHGMPACSGVALGVDRLLMLMTGATTIDAVLSFPQERA
jgi:lysyl-tRNA synthetase class 2